MADFEADEAFSGSDCSSGSEADSDCGAAAFLSRPPPAFTAEKPFSPPRRSDQGEHVQRTPAEVPEGAAPAVGMAALIARLRGDNLRLREALVEAQQDAEMATLALEEERTEKQKLVAELAKARGPAQAEDTASGVNKPCEGATSSSSPPPSAEMSVDHVGTNEAEERREREERLRLEQALVRSKVSCAEATDRADNMEVLAAYYEDQLCALNPSFKSLLASSRPEQGSSRKASRSNPQEQGSSRSPEGSVGKDASNLEAIPTAPTSGSPPKRKRNIKKLVSRIFRPHGAAAAGGAGASSVGAVCAEAPRPASVEASMPRPASSKVPTSGEDAQRQEEVIACLMSELERARRDSAVLQAQLTSGRKTGK